jgi:subtilisin-like proprotein convertase family protein
MRILNVLFTVAAVSLLATGTVLADKQQEMDEYLLKPWSILDLPQIPVPLADVNESEPNNTCGEADAYTLGDVYHAGLTPGDQDWISFSANQNDVITAATDADQGSTTDTYLELYASDCTTQLAFNDDGGPGLFSLITDFKAPYTGTFYLKIRGFSSTTQGLYIAIVTAEPQLGPGFCPVGFYKASKLNANQAIEDLLTICAPTIKFNPQPGQVIADVVIDICLDHTWVGDLTITLTHTSSSGEVKSVDLVQRPGVPQSTFGCSGDLVCDPENKYYFGSDPSLAPLGEEDCDPIIPPACYAVAVENGTGLEIFRGQPCGDGFWELCITDDAAGDTGFLYNWSVHLLCESGPVAVESSTWGDIKAAYRP